MGKVKGSEKTCTFTIKFQVKTVFNPLPHMPILGSSKQQIRTIMMSKIWKNGDTII